MNVQEAHPEIKRAWLLITANTIDIDTIAKGILNLNSQLPNPRDHIIRADSVEGAYNIVVSLFADNDNQVQTIKNMVLGVHYVSSVEMLKVSQNTHHPWPPQDTMGYITDSESKANENQPPAGTQGWNTWG